ncbi:MAG TPA: hypothetical protein H9875_06890 [Candidatus Levilactobacillus faecigallinarum]|uniref:Uncharacterized protein n=1 Tax=Candidatus Levilactobacillus faecigallinarum TaxID=2838638 RepID=A0A9D1QT61_9LACO|nr:hypothetical protein [Candidatus Levilactobacillus faecigallinarum]
MSEKQVEILENLKGGWDSLIRAKDVVSNILAVCDLARPTLENKGHGAYYFDYGAAELRVMLDKHDTDIYQASRILSLLSDKAMDLDSLLGDVTGKLGSSIDFLTASTEKGAPTHD